MPSSKRAVGALAAVLLVTVYCPNAWASDPVQTAGDVLQVALPSAAVLATIGYRDATGAGQFAISYAVTMGATMVLKRAINETRPNGGELSFPSGHTSSSFASAEFMRRRYGWKWGAPFYALAAFVGYSRVESRYHYTRDVVGGAAIGIASSFIFTKPRKKWTAAVAGDLHGGQITFSRIW